MVSMWFRDFDMNLQYAKFGEFWSEIGRDTVVQSFGKFSHEIGCVKSLRRIGSIGMRRPGQNRNSG